LPPSLKHFPLARRERGIKGGRVKQKLRLAGGKSINMKQETILPEGL
jgi:hypothetical protein